MNVKKPENILKLGKADISEIRKLIPRLSEKVWNLENSQKENKFKCFHHTQHIVFRFIEGNRNHRNFYSNPIWDVWQNQLLPIMDSVITKYNYENPVYPKVMLARLAANSVIDSHSDGAGSHPHTHKIHIPIQTNEKAHFFIRDEAFHLKKGIAYEVNNLVPHAVENHGSTDRIHLIFEVFNQENKLKIQ